MSEDHDGDHRRDASKDLVRNGRAALRAGERDRARQLLTRATEYDRDNSDAWLWLSATTDDLAEQKQYLEWAVAANPANSAAVRGLGMVTGKIKTEDLVPAGQTVIPQAPAQPEPASAALTFTCPQCGGRLRFDPANQDLRCDNCGFKHAVERTPAPGPEIVLEYSLATRQGQSWAVAERRFTCQQCSAQTILPPGQTSNTCPFCGSPALVAAADDADLIMPHAVIPMQQTAVSIAERVRTWLGRDFFAPDDLTKLAHSSRLQPVYVPFWRFSLTLTLFWRAQTAKGRDQRWIWQDGDTTFFYDDFLQPGAHALPIDLLSAIGPFDLTGLVRYQPEFLAGWPAGSYDVPLAQASLDTRAAVVSDASKKVWSKAIPGASIATLQVLRPEYKGQTFQLVLLPVWVGAYKYRSKIYRVLANGQTGKVAGDRPTDRLKVTLLLALVAAALVPLAVALYLWLGPLLTR
jgi:DNA-directed RNA polymerase subunit RPC12/RpoP